MIAAAAAVEALAAEARPRRQVRVELDRALGFVLAEPVAADRDYPPTDRSAMDGFAVRAVDVGGTGGALELAGEVRAGQGPGSVVVGPGQAVRVMTGAVVPPGADAVVMLEQTREDAGRVAIEGSVEPGQHIRRRGEEWRAGETILEPGQPVQSAEVAALAALGRTAVVVFDRPRVSVLSTGDEIVEPDRVPLEHQVRNSNARALLAQLEELGLRGDYLGIARDEAHDLAACLERGVASDVLLVTGGVSVGAYDLVRRTLEAAGLRLVFHGVAVKPGKPILAGCIGECLVVGLPGNPVSTYTAFALFVAPALRRMMGHARWRQPELRARLSTRLEARPGRLTYHLARLTTEDGELIATPVRTRGSGDVLSLSRANGFLVTGPESGPVAPGMTLPAVPWRDFPFR